MKAAELKQGDTFKRDKSPENTWRVREITWRRGRKIEIDLISGRLVDEMIKTHGRVPTNWQSLNPRENVTRI